VSGEGVRVRIVCRTVTASGQDARWEACVDDLRPTLRLYLIGVSLVAAALVVCSVAALTLSGSWAPAHLAAALAFLTLTYAGERMTARVGAHFSHSMSTVMLVAAVLVLPPPYPVLVALGAALADDLVRPLPLHKRLFNVAHATIVAGGSSLALAQVASPLPRWEPTQFLTHAPALALVGIVYAILDLGGLQMVMTLSRPENGGDRAPALTTKVLLLEGVGIGMGVVSAIAWAYNPAALLLSLLPVLTVRATFKTIERDAARAAALRRRNAQLEGVIRAGQRLRLLQPRIDLVRPVAEYARDAARASAVAVYLTDETDPTMMGRALTLPAGAAVDAPDSVPVPHDGEDGAAYHVAEDGTLLILLDVDGQTVGGLRLSGVTEDDEDTRHALALLANQAAIALQNAALHERVLAQVSVDGLTGLPNHRAFHARLDEEVARCRRLGRPASLILVDIDGLAAINAVGGLGLGDATLTAVAAAVRHAVRTGDIVARDGGDEFAVLLLDAEREEALASANHIQAAIRAGSGAPVTVRASLGVASIPAHGTTREELVRAARQALVGAKAFGGDRIAEPDDGAGLLGDDLQRIAGELAHANLAAVTAMAAAVDAKDPYTQGHSQRVGRYVVAFGRALGLEATDLARLELAALLHDVGKIAVPDAILTKDERLTDEEFAVIREHPVRGERMLSGLPYLSKDILPAVRHHHERWDGLGYPDGLVGAALPPDAAIMAVADSFDAMTSTRTYRPALPVAEAARRIREGSGTQFAPHVVLAFERALAAGDLHVADDRMRARARTA
jgi:diguanylate cyclase (GGDEF)-like protein